MAYSPLFCVIFCLFPRHFEAEKRTSERQNICVLFEILRTMMGDERRTVWMGRNGNDAKTDLSGVGEFFQCGNRESNCEDWKGNALG